MRELPFSIFVKYAGHIASCSVMRTWNILSSNPSSIFITEDPSFVFYRYFTDTIPVHIVQICYGYCIA